MLIRDVDRSYAPRSRSKEAVSPLRKTAEGLGIFLGRLSEAVREADERSGGDSVDNETKSHGRNPLRGFKLASPKDGEASSFDLSKEGAEALLMLQEARNLAADASGPAVTFTERETSQERIKAIFLDLDAKRMETLSSLLAGATGTDDTLFSLATPESARAAYSGIDEIIMKFLGAEAKSGAGAADGKAPYINHETALSASEQLREFLLDEGPAKAFARFREVNRSNVLGLLQ